MRKISGLIAMNFKHIISLWLVSMLSVFIFNQIYHYIENNKDVTEYIFYREVKSESDNFKIHKWIAFYSNSIVYATINVTWQDILRCDLYDGLWYRYYSYYESRARLEPKDSTTLWVWQGEQPTQPAKCYLDGIVVVNINDWKDKFLHIESNEFTIWAE